MINLGRKKENKNLTIRCKDKNQRGQHFLCGTIPNKKMEIFGKKKTFRIFAYNRTKKKISPFLIYFPTIEFFNNLEKRSIQT